MTGRGTVPSRRPLVAVQLDGVEGTRRIDVDRSARGVASTNTPTVDTGRHARAITRRAPST